MGTRHPETKPKEKDSITETADNLIEVSPSKALVEFSIDRSQFANPWTIKALLIDAIGLNDETLFNHAYEFLCKTYQECHDPERGSLITLQNIDDLLSGFIAGYEKATETVRNTC